MMSGHPLESVRKRLAKGALVPVRALGALLLATVIAVAVALPGVILPLRFGTFDLYQRLLPRERRSNPVTIVAIDEASLALYGQWPWPRDRFARLIERIAAAHPAAVGIDIIMPEPDATSPERLARQVGTDNPELAARLLALPRNDGLLAAQLQTLPIVLGAALTRFPNPPAAAPHPPPLPIAWADGVDGARFLPQFRGTVRSLPELELAARGVAALSSEPDAGVARRIAMLARVGTTVWPALSAEMLRVASNTPYLQARVANNSVQSLTVAGIAIPTDADGRAWIHFAPSQKARIVSAADIVRGRVNAESLTAHLVLIGFYAHGLSDIVSTPLGDRRAGVEVHAEMLENVFDRRLLWRPSWAPWAEGGAFVLLGALAVWFVPVLRPTRAIAWFGGAIALVPALGVLLFRDWALLLDTLTPTVGVLLTFGGMLALTLTETDRQRRQLDAQLIVEREQQARAAGELAAAQRIQLGLLPRAETVLGSDSRATIAAFMQPARSIGGDLYDFFKLDDDHLFIAIGDVSGKGVPASLFMALAKSLTKSSALRDRAALPLVVGRAQTEISRDNPEYMFMTLAALVLDLRNGDLQYVNAGHETPLLVTQAGIVKLAAGGGPPLCVIDDFAFLAAQATLAPGDTLVLVTDGVTEALNAGGEFYGRGRLEGLLRRQRDTAPTAVIANLRDDVLAFAAGTELPDDIAVVVVRYAGAT